MAYFPNREVKPNTGWNVNICKPWVVVEDGRVVYQAETEADAKEQKQALDFADTGELPNA